MDLFPTAVGTRPRLACEIRPEGVVVARGETAAGTLTALARADLRPGAVLPGLKAGNLLDRPAVVAALRRAFDAIAARGADRSRYVTVIVPDAAVRVLLLDFDALPSKPAEALQVVRFRLKKLLPFDVDHALVSFQIMSTERSLLRVLAVAIPQEVLAEYEAAVTEAGMQPGVVLPSTLAALAGLDATYPNALVLNASPAAVTTAIVRSGILLLHRTIEVYPAEASDLSATASPAPQPSALIATTTPATHNGSAAPEWLSYQGNAGEPPNFASAATKILSSPPEISLAPTPSSRPESHPVLAEAGDAAERPPYFASAETTSATAPYRDLGTSDLDLTFVDPIDTAAEWSQPDAYDRVDPTHPEPEATVALLNTAPDVNNRNRDLAESVSVAAAYFEDTLGTLPELVLATGSITAADLNRTLVSSGLEGLPVRDLLPSEALGASVSTTSIPHGWLAGLRGALRS